MKTLLLCLITILCCSILQAQVLTDSLKQKLPPLPDSLKTSYQAVDSIRNNFNKEADSLKTQYDNSIATIDKSSAAINQKIDSLEKLNLPTEKYQAKLDSLKESKLKTANDFKAKADALKTKTKSQIDGLDVPAEYKEPLQKLTGNVDQFNLDTNFGKIPQVEIPGYSLPDMPSGDLTNNIKNISNIGGLPKVETPIGDLGQVTDQVKVYEGDLKNISTGKIDEVKALPETVEKEAGKFAGVDDLEKQSGVVNDYKEKLDALNDPEAAKEKAASMAKEAAIDHFAGKQEQLKAAMDKISKYKQKYSSVSSLKDLPKRPPNPMKGKPLIERIVPGLYLQYQQKNALLLDLNPYAGYRLSGRLTAGLGWNQRIAYNDQIRAWNSRARIFGPRAYVDFILGKGFIAHLEGESMNTFVPSTLRGNPDNGKREWVWSIMTGLKKEYKIYKNLKGTVLIQYNLFNAHYKAPYADRLNSRIGFEYTLKKRK